MLAHQLFWHPEITVRRRHDGQAHRHAEEPDRVARIAAVADEIVKLQEVLARAEIVSNSAPIYKAWRRHSDTHAAGWLSLYLIDDENLAALLQHLDRSRPVSRVLCRSAVSVRLGPSGGTHADATTAFGLPSEAV